MAKATTVGLGAIVFSFDYSRTLDMVGVSGTTQGKPKTQNNRALMYGRGAAKRTIPSSPWPYIGSSTLKKS